MRRIPGFLENVGIDPKAFDQAIYMARGAPYQVPSLVYEELSGMFGQGSRTTSVKGEAVAKAMNDLTRELLSIPVKARLTRPSTTVRNTLSQGIQTTAMLVNDLWKGILKRF